MARTILALMTLWLFAAPALAQPWPGGSGGGGGGGGGGGDGVGVSGVSDGTSTATGPTITLAGTGEVTVTRSGNTVTLFGKRRHAASCATQNGGVENEICLDHTANGVFVCKEVAGCDSGEWTSFPGSFTQGNGITISSGEISINPSDSFGWFGIHNFTAGQLILPGGARSGIGSVTPQSLFMLTDALNPNDCSAGGGSNRVLCMVDADNVWKPFGTVIGGIDTDWIVGDTNDANNALDVAAGGTSATTAAGARSQLGVDPAGTDNSTPVTINPSGLDYLTISNQQITAWPINLANTDYTTGAAPDESVSDDITVDISGVGSVTGGTANKCARFNVSGDLEADGDDCNTGGGGGGDNTSLDSEEAPGDENDVFYVPMGSGEEGMWCVDVDGSGACEPDESDTLFGSIEEMGQTGGLEGYDFHVADFCGDTPEGTCTPDGDVDSYDAQRLLYAICRIHNTATGEGCGKMTLPAGRFKWRHVLQVGDGDEVANNYGWTDAGGDMWLDGNDSPFGFDSLDGRIFGLIIEGQGMGRTYTSNKGVGGTVLENTNTVSAPMIQLNGAAHVQLRNFMMLGHDGTNARADSCIKLAPDNEFGVVEGLIIEDVGCANAVRGLDLDDGDTLADLKHGNMTLATALTGSTSQVVVHETINANIPKSGVLEITDDAGQIIALQYDDWNTSTFDLVNETDFSDPNDATDVVCDPACNKVDTITNGKSERIEIRNMWIRDAVIPVRWNSNNTQAGHASIHAQNWGNNVHGSPHFDGSEVGSCGGSENHDNGSPIHACGVDWRQGDLVLEHSIFACGGGADSGDVMFHATPSHNDFTGFDIRGECDTIDTWYASKGGLTSGQGGSMTLISANIAALGTQDIKVIDWGSVTPWNIQGFDVNHSFGGGVEFEFDGAPQANMSDFRMNISGLSILLAQSGDTNDVVFDLETSDPEMSGSISYSVRGQDLYNNVTGAQQTSGDPDGINDFDGLTKVNHTYTMLLGDLADTTWMDGATEREVHLWKDLGSGVAALNKTTTIFGGEANAVGAAAVVVSGGEATLEADHVLSRDRSDTNVFSIFDNDSGSGTFDCSDAPDERFAILDADEDSGDANARYDFCKDQLSAVSLTGIAGTSLDMDVKGTLRGEVNTVVSTTSPVDLTSDLSLMRSVMHIADHGTPTSDVTYNLPSAVAGLNACFYDNGGGAGLVIVDANTGDEILLDGVSVGAADSIENTGANGEEICLQAIDATYWITRGDASAWSDSNP